MNNISKLYSRKRILIIARWPVGGINTYLRYVYSHSIFNTYNFVLLVPNINEVEIIRQEMGLENFEINAVSLQKFGFYRQVIYNVLFKKFDIIHSHGFSSGLIAAIPAKLSRKKHIVTAHDVFNVKQFKGIKGWLKQYVFGKILGMADIVQPVSYGAEKNILYYLPNLKNHSTVNIYTIVNGIDISRFQNSEVRNLHKELKLPAETFLVGFMGRFMSQKGFIYLLKAVGKLIEETELKERIRIVAVGSGGFVREEKKFVAEQGMNKIVYFLPSTNEVAKTLRGFDLLVMPSLWEACGLLAMEALVSGVPVIGSGCEGLSEVLEGTPAKKVRPRDVDMLAGEIKEHIHNNRRSEFEAYAPIAAKRYDISRTAREVAEMYNNLV